MHQNVFKSGLLSVTFREKAPESIISLVSNAGLQSIEWGGDKHLPAGDTAAAERLGRQTREAGLDVSAYGSYYKFEDIDASSETEGPSPLAVLDSAEALGTGMVRIWPGSLGSAEAPERWRRRLVERTQELAALAAERSLSLGFEFHNNSLTDTAASTARLLDEVNRPNVSTFWQTNRGVSRESHLEGLRFLRERVSHVHCHHLVAHRQPPFELLEHGEEDWIPFLRLLPETGRPRFVSIEFVRDGSEESFRRDAATLRRWLSTLDTPAV
ncbi:MAG: sugar phosphate isomerase/epimerase family protein [Oceanipulchritudo sp.]